jgi:hypothetical protein
MTVAADCGSAQAADSSAEAGATLHSATRPAAANNARVVVKDSIVGGLRKREAAPRMRAWRYGTKLRSQGGEPRVTAR